MKPLMYGNQSSGNVAAVTDWMGYWSHAFLSKFGSSFCRNSDVYYDSLTVLLALNKERVVEHLFTDESGCSWGNVLINLFYV